MMHPTAVPRTRGGAAATLTVWKFDTYDGADHAEAILERLAQHELITIQDAVIDKVHETFAEMHPELIHRNLSPEDQARLRELLAED
jgi:uncharacterized membrane protein